MGGHWDALLSCFSTSSALVASKQTPGHKIHTTKGAAWSIWKKLFPQDHSLSGPSPLFPIIWNPAFPPTVTDPIYCSRQADSKFRALHFIVQSLWASFPHSSGTKVSEGKCRSQFLRSLPAADNYQPQLTSFETDCTQTGKSRHCYLDYVLCLAIFTSRPTFILG